MMSYWMWVTLRPRRMLRLLFFFKDTATPEIYSLSLHDALPIYDAPGLPAPAVDRQRLAEHRLHDEAIQDRKSTRLNSSHVEISYAVFCLKKKKTTTSPSRSPP